MVYYYTSGNVKIIRNLLIDYGSHVETAPYDYMKSYIEKCPKDMEDSKLGWLAETFIGIQKHSQFLRAVIDHLPGNLLDEDQVFFTVLFYGLIFQIEPKDAGLLYKCMFNLSKPLLENFISFLNDQKVLRYLSRVGQKYYDTKFITENIINPVFGWKPCLSEMANTYAAYVKKKESRKVKPTTVPVPPTLMSRRGMPLGNRVSRPISLPPLLPSHEFVSKTKRIVPRTDIDDKLKKSFEKNKVKATKLLNDVKNTEHHYALVKSNAYFEKLANIKDEIANSIKPLAKIHSTYSIKKTCQPVKETAATIKRMNKKIQLAEQEEIQWFQNAINSKNTAKIEELQEFDRQERERQRLLDIEKKHLMGQISYEEALLSKRKYVAENKNKYEQFIKEKEIWNEQIDNWRRSEMIKNRKQIEKLSELELHVLEARQKTVMKNKEASEQLKKQNQILIQKALKAQQDDLDRKVNMIKEFKILANIAKQARVPKIVDLTETSGIGLLCEMSIAELQERLNAVKIDLHDELNRKKCMIIKVNEEKKEELKETKKSIQSYMNEKERNKTLKKESKRTASSIKNPPSKEIDDLKKILEEKRQLRMKLSK